MDLGISGKTALVAASSKGLGRAAAEGLAREGARVVLCARHEQELRAAAEEIRAATGAEVLAVTADVAVPGDILRVVEGARDAFGGVDILVNNAGGPPPGYFQDMTDEDWQLAHELTLMSTVRFTREVLPRMREQGYGRIINITSVSVKQPLDHLLLSNSLRLGVVGWAKTLSNQVAAEGVTINNVCPGWTRTRRVTDLLEARAKQQGMSMEEAERTITGGIPMQRLGEAGELASLIVYLASNQAAYMTGTTIQVDGGLTAGYS
ncbi:MAG: SDR family oxidoreductase [Gammaproteobacteria bacterium]|jgi:3-oxoacyl-[acyl-carrier protein] reductase